MIRDAPESLIAEELEAELDGGYCAPLARVFVPLAESLLSMPLLFIA